MFVHADFFSLLLIGPRSKPGKLMSRINCDGFLLFFSLNFTGKKMETGVLARSNS